MAILIKDHQRKTDVNRQRVRRFLGRLLKILDCEDKEISLLFVDDDNIREINKDFLGRDYPTNVITFSLSEGKFGNINPHVLGDIVISTETAARDACESGITLDDEIDFLMIHGLLHLLDYNHENTSFEEAQRMKKRERELFFQLKGYMIE